MQPRIEYDKVVPDALSAMMGLENYVRQSNLDASLQDLVKIRVSQMNRCAYCVDVHTKEAISRGESEQRLRTVWRWQETPFFTERERAALAWAEAVTELNWEYVPDRVYELARTHFDEKQLVDLTMAIIAINGWNRLAISFRTGLPGEWRLG